MTNNLLYIEVLNKHVTEIRTLLRNKDFTDAYFAIDTVRVDCTNDKFLSNEYKKLVLAIEDFDESLTVNKEKKRILNTQFRAITRYLIAQIREAHFNECYELFIN